MINAMHIMWIVCGTIALRMFCRRCVPVSGFKIPRIPATTNKSIRFPNDLIEEVEAVIVGKECNFSAFVIEAVRNALAELKEQEK